VVQAGEGGCEGVLQEGGDVRERAKVPKMAKGPNEEVGWVFDK